jgi:hypothetical protein
LEKTIIWWRISVWFMLSNTSFLHSCL